MRHRKRESDQTELARLLECLGPRRDAELAVDRPGVAVNRVVRQVELATDVALGEPPAQQPQDDELALAEHSVPMARTCAPRMLERVQPLEQNARVGAGIDRRS